MTNLVLRGDVDVRLGQQHVHSLQVAVLRGVEQGRALALFSVQIKIKVTI